MDSFLEIEFKNMLDADKYNYFLNFFNCSALNCIKQVNYYFDTLDSTLKKNDMGLRIRNILDKEYILTLKVSQEIGKLEIEQHLTKEGFNTFLATSSIKHLSGNTISYLKEILNINDLLLTVDFTTFRYEIPSNFGVFMLDKTVYKNHVDFEIELEVESYEDGLKAFNNFLKLHNIPFIEANTKLARAFL